MSMDAALNTLVAALNANTEALKAHTAALAGASNDSGKPSGSSGEETSKPTKPGTEPSKRSGKGTTSAKSNAPAATPKAEPKSEPSSNDDDPPALTVQELTDLVRPFLNEFDEGTDEREARKDFLKDALARQGAKKVSELKEEGRAWVGMWVQKKIDDDDFDIAASLDDDDLAG